MYSTPLVSIFSGIAHGSSCGHSFLKNPWNFCYFTQKLRTKQSLNPGNSGQKETLPLQKFHKIVLHKYTRQHLGNSKIQYFPKNKNQHFSLSLLDILPTLIMISEPPNISRAFSLIPLEIPCSQS